jgi:hypothetical protein
MRENRIRENIASNFIRVNHVDGKVHLVDIFTKEMKDTTNFVEIRDAIMCRRSNTC